MDSAQKKQKVGVLGGKPSPLSKEVEDDWSVGPKDGTKGVKITKGGRVSQALDGGAQRASAEAVADQVAEASRTRCAWWVVAAVVDCVPVACCHLRYTASRALRPAVCNLQPGQHVQQ